MRCWICECSHYPMNEPSTELRCVLTTVTIFDLLKAMCDLVFVVDDDSDDNGESRRHRRRRLLRRRRQRQRRRMERTARLYELVARTFASAVLLIRQTREQLLKQSSLLSLSSSFLLHLDDTREHERVFDHTNREGGLIARLTVVAGKYTRELIMRYVRHVIQSTVSRRCYDETPRRDAIAPMVSFNAVKTLHKRELSFFLCIVRKLINRALRLVSRQTLEETKETKMKKEEPSSPPPTRESDDITCHVCHRSFAKTFHYLQHIRVHYRLNLYLCDECDEAFVQQNGLNYHARKCCRGSGIVVERQQRRRRRLERTVTFNGINAHERHFEMCESCERFFENGRDLRNHVLQCHAVRNIDLGVNKTQQEYIRSLLFGSGGGGGSGGGSSGGGGGSGGGGE